MSDAPKPWSTPKTLLVALVITLSVMFFGNGICNEWLELGVPTWVFAGIAGALMSPVAMRWHIAQKILRRKRDRQ